MTKGFSPFWGEKVKRRRTQVGVGPLSVGRIGNFFSKFIFTVKFYSLKNVFEIICFFG